MDNLEEDKLKEKIENKEEEKTKPEFHNLSLRLTPYEKSVISQAVSLMEKTNIYIFSVRTLRERAEDFLKDHFKMDDIDFARFKAVRKKQMGHF